MKKILISIVLILFATSFLWSESMIKLKKKDYGIVDSQDNYSVVGIEIINKKILSRLISEKNYIIVFSIDNDVFKAKGQTVLQASVPDNCDYVFFTDENGNIFIMDNKIKLYKIHDE